jgi:hypothetical protein
MQYIPVDNFEAAATSRSDKQLSAGNGGSAASEGFSCELMMPSWLTKNNQGRLSIQLF